jgi:hypothetical protein
LRIIIFPATNSENFYLGNNAKNKYMKKEELTSEDLQSDVQQQIVPSKTSEQIETTEAHLSSFSMAQMVSNSTNLSQKKAVISLIPEYYEFEAVGQSIRGVYLDTFVVNYRDDSTGELIPKKAIRFISDKVIYINSGYLLVDGILKSGIQRGANIEITYTGKDKNAKKYSVQLLD